MSVNESYWKLLDVKPYREGNTDYVSIAVQGKGQIYVSVLTGPKGMLIGDIIDAQRAVLGHLLQLVGHDISCLHARTLEPGEVVATDSALN